MTHLVLGRCYLVLSFSDLKIVEVERILGLLVPCCTRGLAPGPDESMPSSVACSGLSDNGEGEKEWEWCEREGRTIRGRGGKNGKRKGVAAPLPSFLPFFSCLRFHNSADPTISEPETAYLLGSLKRPASPPEGWLYAGWLKKSQR